LVVSLVYVLVCRLFALVVVLGRGDRANPLPRPAQRLLGQPRPEGVRRSLPPIPGWDAKPPDADPHVRWCGQARGEPGAYPIDLGSRLTRRLGSTRGAGLWGKKFDSGRDRRVVIAAEPVQTARRADVFAVSAPVLPRGRARPRW
jgi:hypothetical protein